MHTLVNIYPHSGRPSREVFTGNYNDCYEEMISICDGNEILMNNYTIVVGSFEKNTYYDEVGKLQWV